LTVNTRRRLIPLCLTVIVIIADQVLKAVIVATIPANTIGVSLLGGFLRIINVQNTGIAFSIGQGAPQAFRGLFFIILPILVLLLLGFYYVRSADISQLQRWAIAGILGGGAGNLIDRVVRPHGVVDFIDVKFYGLFGLDRWPTFNLADATVVVCGILLLVSVFFNKREGER